MPLRLARPDIGEAKKKELQNYVTEMWRRAKEGRQAQVDGDYDKWSKAYDGSPLEKVRTVPFYKASNLVVPLIRIYIDTFTARTLNILFATKPLYIVEGMPAELQEAFELYLNRKAMYDWQHYRVARELCFRGNKNGTVVHKHPWVEKSTIDINVVGDNSFSEEKITYYMGPESLPIPFEDFYVYPITINRLEDALLKFHRVRYAKEDAERRVAEGEWTLPEGKTLATYLKHPSDNKRVTQQSDAGVQDTQFQEIPLVEAYLDYAVMEDGAKYYSIIVVFEENTGDIFDVYFNPYPRNMSIFTDYRPFPQEDLWYGESMCSILGMMQEEVTRIHNERRDNSTIASSVVFKRRNGSLLPNPSTNWYPGKVWDLEDMDDLEVMEIGRNYEAMIQQEDYCFNLAGRLSGIDDGMQGASAGQMGKHGIYNTSGTLAVMAEGNQRQDTNIRDVREAMGSIGLTSARLQAAFDPNDPLIQTLPKSSQQAAHDALAYIASSKARYLRIEVKASSAGANSEIKRANLMAINQVLGQYGAALQQMAPQLMGKQLNPGLQMLMNDILSMQSTMAKKLLKAYDETDAVDILPNYAKAIELAHPGGSRGSQEESAGGGLPAVSPGGPQGASGAVPRELLESIAALPGGSGGATQPAGMEAE